MKYKVSLILLSLVLAFVSGRIGKFFADYTVAFEDGRVTTPYLSLGFAFMYSLVPLALFIFFVCSSRVERVKYEDFHLKKRTFWRPPDSFRFLLPLLLAAVGMSGVLFVKNPNIGNDALGYILPVYRFMQGETFSGDLPPGYGILSYLLFGFTHDIEAATMLAASLSYMFSVITAFSIVRLLAGRAGGVLAAFLITFCPMILEYSFVSLSTVSYIFFALLSCWLYLNVILYKTESYTWHILLGFALGYAWLIRDIEGVALVTLAGGFLVFLKFAAFIKARRFSWKQLSYPASTLLVLLLFDILLSYPVYLDTGTWVFSGRLYTYITRQVSEESEEHVESPDVQYSENQNAPSEQQASADSTISMLDLKPAAFETITYLIPFMLRRLFHITFYALIPVLVLLFFSFFALILLLLMKTRTIPGKFRHYGRVMTIICTFLLFMAPIGVPLVQGYIPLRYMVMHAPFLLLACAVIVSKLLAFLLKRYASYGMGLFCLFSLTLASGLWDESPLFRNRFLTEGFRLTKESLQHLDEGMPGEALEKLKPLKWKKFAGEQEFLQAVEELIGREWIEMRGENIVQEALISSLGSFLTLPEVFAWESVYVGLRAAGIWLGYQHPDNLADLKIMVRRGPLIFFYAEGRDKAPAGTFVDFVRDASLEQIVTIMRTEAIDYLVLDRHYVQEFENYVPLWENPSLAHEIGLRQVYQDPENLFQFYSLQN